MTANDSTDGVMDVRKPNSDILETVKRTSGAIAYSSAYYVAFGAVYGATVIAELFPKNNVFAYGLADGASAARRASAARHEETKRDDTTAQELAAAPGGG